VAQLTAARCLELQSADFSWTDPTHAAASHSDSDLHRPSSHNILLQRLIASGDSYMKLR